jgi:NADH dehydrogenase/NADH:ubiquinone oxidoreductase subunit G
MSTTKDERRVGPLDTRQPLTVEVDGELVAAYAGESVATVLLALGQQVFRHTERKHAPRGLYCGMGVCFDCLVTIDGIENVRACMTPVAEGMVIETHSEQSAAAGDQAHD